MLFFRSKPWHEIEYWALDLETSGLEAARDQILSVGMVPIRGGAIHWGDHFYSLVRPAEWQKLDGEAIRVHHILPEELTDAPPLPAIVLEIEARLAGGAAIVLHHASFDLSFLRRAFSKHGRSWPSPSVVDTRVLSEKYDERQQRLHPYRLPSMKSLAELVQLFELPTFAAHHALSDALATAQLFLALRSRLGLRSFRQVRTG